MTLPGAVDDSRLRRHCPAVSRGGRHEFINGIVFGRDSIRRQRLRQAPELSVNLFARYVWDLGTGATIVAKADYRYQDESFYDPDNNPITLVPDYSLVDARLAYTSPAGAHEIALWGKNLGDEDYVRHIYSQRGGTISFANYGAPRQVGLTYTYNYE